MKRGAIFVTLVAVWTVVLLGCDSETTTDGQPTGMISARVNGQEMEFPWIDPDVQRQIEYTDYETTVLIFAADVNIGWEVTTPPKSLRGIHIGIFLGPTLLNVPVTLETERHPSGVQLAYKEIHNEDGKSVSKIYSTLFGGRGTITITEFTGRRIKGEFSFVGKEMLTKEAVTVKDGYFEVNNNMDWDWEYEGPEL